MDTPSPADNPATANIVKNPTVVPWAVENFSGAFSETPGICCAEYNRMAFVVQGDATAGGAFVSQGCVEVAIGVVVRQRQQECFVHPPKSAHALWVFPLSAIQGATHVKLEQVSSVVVGIGVVVVQGVVVTQRQQSSFVHVPMHTCVSAFLI